MMIQSVWKFAEKGFVGGATLAALLPLWQWYSERDERRIERLSGFIGAGDTCLKWLRSDLIEALASEAWHASQVEVAEDEVNLVPLPVQIRANMTIFCGEMLNYLQNDFGKFDEPAAIDYYTYLYDAAYWVDPMDFEDYLSKVHKNPALSGSHGSYEFAGREGEFYDWQVPEEGFEDEAGSEPVNE